MRLTLDDDTKKVVVVDDSGVRREFDFYTPEAFHYLSAMWVKMGWGLKYIYTFTWMGRPIIQLPDDMFRVQEVIYSLKPDVIVETGIAHGGSLIFYASLCKTMGKGRVVGVDIEIRPHNREAIEKHPLFPYITLIEGNAVSEDTFERVRAECGGGDENRLGPVGFLPHKRPCGKGIGVVFFSGFNGLLYCGNGWFDARS